MRDETKEITVGGCRGFVLDVLPLIVLAFYKYVYGDRNEPSHSG